VQLACELPDPPPDLVTDPEKLATVLKNLVGNAVKFTSAGHVRVHVSSTADTATIHVEDTGIGIPAEHLDSIFEMFRQVDPPETRKHGGLGLGLWVVRRLVEDLGAEMAVESRPGEGTTFRIVLPLRPPDTATL
jgi:signal transduction histidine kinase